MMKEEHKKTIEECASTKNQWFRATALIVIGAFSFSQAVWTGEINITPHSLSLAKVSCRSIFLKLKEETVSFLLPSAYAAEEIPVSPRQKSNGSMPYFYQYKPGRSLQVAIEDENGKVIHYSSSGDNTFKPSFPSPHSDKYKPIVSPTLERRKVDSLGKKADSISIPPSPPLIDATTKGEEGRPSHPKEHNEQVLAIIPESDSRLKRKDFSFGPQPEPPDDASSPEEPIELQKHQPEATSQVPVPVAPPSSQPEEQLFVSADENDADVTDFTVVFYNDVLAFLYLENSLCGPADYHNVNGSRAPPVAHPGLNPSNKRSNILLGEENQDPAFHFYPCIILSSDATILFTNPNIPKLAIDEKLVKGLILDSRCSMFDFTSIQYQGSSILLKISVDFSQRDGNGFGVKFDIDRDELGVGVK